MNIHIDPTSLLTSANKQTLTATSITNWNTQNQATQTTPTLGAINTALITALARHETTKTTLTATMSGEHTLAASQLDRQAYQYIMQDEAHADTINQSYPQE